MTQKITKAVIPAAGFGTRFLPQTKAMPKEMLPIVDKPVIQTVVEGLVDAGITDIIIVTGYHKRAIEDHFDEPMLDLIENLKAGGEKKKKLLEETQKISSLANFYYVRQKGPYGNGTPLLNVREIVGQEPFIYTWSDDFIEAEPSEFRQLISVYEKYECSVLAGIRAQSDEDYEKYGYASGPKLEDGIIDIEKIIEKPGKNNAPSDLGNVSSFLFTSEIFKYLDQALESLDGGELYYNDVLNLMLQGGERVVSAEIKGGVFYDTGSKIGYLKTIINQGLKHPDIKGELRKYLKSLAL